MQGMHEMKLSPLAGGERAKHGMVEDARRTAKTSFAAGDGVIHGGKFFGSRPDDFFRRHAARDGAVWSFTAFGKIAEFRDEQDGNALFHGHGSSQRPAFLETSLE